MSNKQRKAKRDQQTSPSMEDSASVQADGCQGETVRQSQTHGMVVKLPEGWPIVDCPPPDYSGVRELGRKVREEREQRVYDALLSADTEPTAVWVPGGATEKEQETICKLLQATPREFVPRDCTQCTALRPPRQSYSRVYCKRGKIRFCKCGFCGATWSQEGP